MTNPGQAEAEQNAPAVPLDSSSRLAGQAAGHDSMPEAGREEGGYLSWQGRPTFLLGVNYWSRAGGPRMWRVWDEASIRSEVRQMAEMGLHVCRAFLYWPDFMPTPNRVEPQMLARLRRFLDACGEAGLGAYVSLIVGHMSGENWDVPWRQGRSLYEDPEMLAAQELLAREAARAGRGSRGLAGWILSNEMSLYGGSADPDAVARWAERLASALRKEDPGAVVGIGDGAWNLHGGQNGFNLEKLAPVVDYFGPHVYVPDMDSARHSWIIPGHFLRLWSVEKKMFGSRRQKPGILEEFGGSATQVSEENQAAYYRETLHDTLLTGGAGAWGWCFSDFNLPRQAPYVHHAFEMLFGITAADGRWKPAAHEFRLFRNLLDQLPPVERLRWPRPSVAILVPSYLNTRYPFSIDDPQIILGNLLESLTLCGMAGVRATFVEEGDDLQEYRMVLLPSTQKLLATTWDQLADYAREGGVVYGSFFAGHLNVHQSLWQQNFEAFTGNRHRLRYGIYDAPEGKQLEVRWLEASLAAAGPGGLAIPISQRVWPPYGLSFLPVEAVKSRVLAVDGQGNPLLTRHALGRGRVYFVTYPWEYMALLEPEANRRFPFYSLYRALFLDAGLVKSYVGTDPWIELTPVAVEGSTEVFLWVHNRAWEERRARVGGWQPVRRLYASGEVSGQPRGTLRMGPKAVAVWQVRRDA